MKKIIVMFATLIMSFAFAISVMAAPSPDDEPFDEPDATTSEQQKTQEEIDKKTQIIDDEFYDGKKDNGNGSDSKTTTTTTTSSSSTSTSSSPKTGDQGAPVTLVYASLAAAALAVYAAKHVKEQY